MIFVKIFGKEKLSLYVNTDKVLFFPGLNEIRCIAALGVVYYHTIPYNAHNILGRSLVTLFFVLSGFLITFLLLKERQEQDGKIDIGFFYLKRILRIWPLYFLLILVGFIIYPLIFEPDFLIVGSDKWWKEITYYLLFVPNISTEHIPYATQLWSIGIEEQFYLIWPILVTILGKRIDVASWLIILFFLIISFSYHFGQVYWISIAMKFEGLSSLAMGTLGACYFFYRRELIKTIYDPIIQIGTLAVLLTHFALNIYYPIANEIIYSCFYIILILGLATNPRNIIKINNRYMSDIGIMSYGIYVYHGIVLDTVEFGLRKSSSILASPLESLWLRLIIVITITVTVSYFSYHFVEKKIIAFRNYFLTR